MGYGLDTCESAGRERRGGSCILRAGITLPASIGYLLVMAEVWLFSLAAANAFKRAIVASEK
jgi:hypothetical protein